MPRRKNKPSSQANAVDIEQEIKTTAPPSAAAADADLHLPNAQQAPIAPPSTPPHADRILRAATPKQNNMQKKGGRKKVWSH